VEWVCQNQHDHDRGYRTAFFWFGFERWWWGPRRVTTPFIIFVSSFKILKTIAPRIERCTNHRAQLQGWRHHQFLPCIAKPMGKAPFISCPSYCLFVPPLAPSKE
jgi:hypothetical protein